MKATEAKLPAAQGNVHQRARALSGVVVNHIEDSEPGHILKVVLIRGGAIYTKKLQPPPPLTGQKTRITSPT